MSTHTSRICSLVCHGNNVPCYAGDIIFISENLLKCNDDFDLMMDSMSTSGSRILEEEFEKREKLEQLKTELEGLLEEERHKREGLEEERLQHETLLTEEQLKLEQLEQERLNMDAKMEVSELGEC